MAKLKSRPVDELTFEAAFEELEAVVRQLEEGALTLDEALAVFERGQALSARCQALLESAELKVQQLAPRAGGGYGLQPFEAGER
jgi:exodeoxyribonuclease VII small subunit